mgnify:CR=1 FL=1
MSEECPRFRTSTVKGLLDAYLNELSGGKKIKVDPAVYELVSEYLRCVVIEATERSSNAAGDSRAIDATHLEKILPQLLLDIC